MQHRRSRARRLRRIVSLLLGACSLALFRAASLQSYSWCGSCFAGTLIPAFVQSRSWSGASFAQTLAPTGLHGCMARSAGASWQESRTEEASAEDGEHGSLVRLLEVPSPEQRKLTQDEVGSFMKRVRMLAQEALTWPHLPPWERLEWAALLHDAVPMKELPPWFLEERNLTRRDVGVDLLSLDGERAVQCKCYNGVVPTIQIRRFLRVSKLIFQAKDLILLTSNSSKLTQKSVELLRDAGAHHYTITQRAIKKLANAKSILESSSASNAEDNSALRSCQDACLRACHNGSRVIEMACGSGKTRVMRELANKADGKVLIVVPSLVLLGQFFEAFPTFCCAGTGYNDRINYDAEGFLAVSDSAHLLANVTFAEIYIDEAHHPLPPGCPGAARVYRFSATHRQQPDFEYPMGQAIEDGILCDYDVVIPIVSANATNACLADMIRRRAGHFRRILAYCNSISEAKRFQKALQEVGLFAWHINGFSPASERARVMAEFAGPLKSPAHVMVTVQILGEGVNIPNADTCMFLQPRRSYVSIVQAIGRVLRQHPTKPLGHVILPAVPDTFGKPGYSEYDRATQPDNITHLAKQKHPPVLSRVTNGSRVAFASFRQMHGGRLERFMMALAHADKRLKEALSSDRRGRVHFIDARSMQDSAASPMPIIKREFKTILLRLCVEVRRGKIAVIICKLLHLVRDGFLCKIHPSPTRDCSHSGWAAKAVRFAVGVFPPSRCEALRVLILLSRSAWSFGLTQVFTGEVVAKTLLRT
ncbi:unnamed protein product [Polarella glacialis]|uniref:RNA helicase n=1 Tax=Polarella glacialis TaxID=89957 RepID=A0A813GJM3_POLGL|nr:unnamed protein product [Polarella glacialis]